MYHRTCQFARCIVALIFSGTVAASVAAQATYAVTQGAYRVEVTDAKVSAFTNRNLLGTHSLWWGYQADLMMPGGTKSYPVVSSFFSSTKGVIRYGGAANSIPWETCFGPVESRSALKIVDWAGPMKCAFGVSEYLATVRATGGKEAWLIANIVGGLDRQLFSTEDLKLETGQAASALEAAGNGLKRYWELGNELERGSYRWSPEMIAGRASVAGREIKDRDPGAQLILPLIEYDDPKQPSRRVFNERLLRAMTQPVDGLALHLYYDGAPGGPSIPTQINTIVDTAALYRRLKGHANAIWITEHGRWPEGLPSNNNWKASWYKTNNMDGVLGTADFLIALSQIEDVAGAMLHGLRAGPWNVFDKTALGPEPSGVGKLLLLLAETGQAARLQTHSFSQNQSSYKGGYDMRAAAFEDTSQQTISLWIINRAATPIAVDIDLPARAANSELIAGKSLVCPVANGRCAGSQYLIFPVNKEQITNAGNGPNIKLAARSVTSLTFGRQQ